MAGNIKTIKEKENNRKVQTTIEKNDSKYEAVTNKANLENST